MAKVNHKLSLTIAWIGAFSLGLAIPALMSGRAVMGVFMGLALICSLLLLKFRPFNLCAIFLHKYIFYFLVIIWLSWLPSVFFSLDASLSFTTWMRAFPMVLAVAFICWMIKEEIDQATRVLTIGIVFFGGLALVGLLVSPDFFGFIRQKEFDYSSLHKTVKPVINALTVFIPLFLYLFFIQKKIFRSLYVICILIIVSLTLIIDSKASILAIGLIILSMGLTYFLRSTDKKQFFIFAVSLSVIVFAIMLWLKSNPSSFSYHNSELGYLPTWLIDLHRQFIWQFSIDIAADSPWVGYGVNASNLHPQAEKSVLEYFNIENAAGQFKASTLPGHPHNWMIELIIDTGLIGFLPLLSFVVFIFLKTIQKYRNTANPIFLCMIGVHSAYWGAGLFNFSYWSAWWQLTYYVCIFISIIIYLNRLNLKGNQY